MSKANAARTLRGRLVPTSSGCWANHLTGFRSSAISDGDDEARNGETATPDSTSKFDPDPRALWF
jgi:hypothetical protein